MKNTKLYLLTLIFLSSAHYSCASTDYLGMYEPVDRPNIPPVINLSSPEVFLYGTTPLPTHLNSELAFIKVNEGTVTTPQGTTRKLSATKPGVFITSADGGQFLSENQIRILRPQRNSRHYRLWISKKLPEGTPFRLYSRRTPGKLVLSGVVLRTETYSRGTNRNAYQEMIVPYGITPLPAQLHTWLKPITIQEQTELQDASQTTTFSIPGGFITDMAGNPDTFKDAIKILDPQGSQTNYSIWVSDSKYIPDGTQFLIKSYYKKPHQTVFQGTVSAYAARTRNFLVDGLDNRLANPYDYALLQKNGGGYITDIYGKEQSPKLFKLVPPSYPEKDYKITISSKVPVGFRFFIKDKKGEIIEQGITTHKPFSHENYKWVPISY